jgi:ligand-binding SRPBCC domain-containing protein
VEHVFRTTTRLPLPRAEVFPFFAAAENLERITPPELRFRITTGGPVQIHEGAHIAYRLRLFGVSFGWTTEITEWNPPHAFTDAQIRGPYRQWIHRHTFREDGGETVMDDEVRYRLPLFPAGEVAAPLVALQVRRIFAYRARAIRRILLGEGR